MLVFRSLSISFLVLLMASYAYGDINGVSWKDIQKPPYTGPVNIPDPQVILQGGDVAPGTIIPSLPYSDNGTTVGYNDDYNVI